MKAICQTKFCESKTTIDGIHHKRVELPQDQCRSGKIWAVAQKKKFCESKTTIDGIHCKRVGLSQDECRSGKIWAENIGFPQVSLDTSRAYLKKQGSRKTNVEVGKYGQRI